MSLKVELKPKERLIIGNCLITNSDQRTKLFIEGEAPILREKDIMTPDGASTPARRVYLALQLAYTSTDPTLNLSTLDDLLADFVSAVPSSQPIAEEITNWILTKNLYKALKSAQKLIAYETEIFEHAKSGSSSIPAGGTQDGDAA